MSQLHAESLSEAFRAPPHQLTSNLEAFEGVLRRAERAFEKGRHATAAAWCEIAALCAIGQHPGIFASRQLEGLLHRISATIPGHYAGEKSSRSAAMATRSVLHVASQVQETGGLSRMMSLWMNYDGARRHSLALTRQGRKPIPHAIGNAVRRSGGRVEMLDREPASLIDRALHLRRMAAEVDVVVLHIWNEDVVPSLAFPAGREGPLILFLDHADHMFWVGLGASDFVLSMRESGMHLARERRGVERLRNLMLPIAVARPARALSRAAAKRKLGLPEDSVLLLSMARAVKYRTVEDRSYADAHVAALSRHPQSILAVVGSGLREDWAEANRRVGGRIHTYAETPETKTFFEAADIYVDSFPFVSITSMLEAGMHELPLLTRFPYPDDRSQILGADAPGLRDCVIRVTGLDEYTERLASLIEDEALRRRLGEHASACITANHEGAAWKGTLEDVYSRAASVGRRGGLFAADEVDRQMIDAPDAFIEAAFGREVNVDELLHAYERFLPWNERLALIGSRSSGRAVRKLRLVLLERPGRSERCGPYGY